MMIDDVTERSRRVNALWAFKRRNASAVFSLYTFDVYVSFTLTIINHVIINRKISTDACYE